MTPDEYQKQCLTTAIFPTIGARYVYLVLGLCGEWAEMEEAWLQFKETSLIEEGLIGKARGKLYGEIGDVLWYCAMLLTEFDASLEVKIKKAIELLALCKTFEKTLPLYPLRIAERVKKVFRDEDWEISELSKVFIKNEIVQIMAFLLLKVGRARLIECMVKNVEKLRSRKERGVLNGRGDCR